MKGALFTTAVGAIALLATSPAAAASFTPVNTNFTATGEVGFANGSVGFTCTANLRGKTGKRGRAKILGFKLSGSDTHCAATTATGLPWKVIPTGPTGARVSRVGFTGAIGACGPGPGAVMVNGSGVWTFDDLLPPACIFSGGVNTSPPITIKP